MQLLPINKNNLIEKRNVLNEMRSYNMKLQELRFFSIYLSKINARDDQTRVVRFSISDFKRIMELKQNNIKYIKKITDSLLCKIIHIPDEYGGYLSFQLFKNCRVSKDEEGEWFIEINAHDDALPLMFDFKSRYFTYQLWNTLRLTSGNQLRMYEILKQYEKKGERKIDLVGLRNLLGIEPIEYPVWRDFRRRILDACQTALEEKTDIKYTYEPIRKGRGGKVIGVNFKISKNENYIDQLTLDEFIDLDKSDEIFEQMTDFINEEEIVINDSLIMDIMKECSLGQHKFSYEQFAAFKALVSAIPNYSDRDIKALIIYAYNNTCSNPNVKSPRAYMEKIIKANIRQILLEAEERDNKIDDDEDFVENSLDIDEIIENSVNNVPKYVSKSEKST